MGKRKLTALILCLLLTTGILGRSLVQNVRASSSDEIRDQIEELEDEGKELQKKIDSLEELRQENLDQLEQMVAEKQVLDQQITLINQQILNTQEQIRSLKILIADKQALYDEATAKHQALNDKYIHRIRAMEEQGKLTYWSIIFKANSFTDLLDRMTMMAEIAAADRARLEELRLAAREVQESQAALTEQQTSLQERLSRQNEQEDELTTKRAEAYTLIRNLVALGEEFDELLALSEQEQQDLLLQIAGKEQEFDRAAYLEWLATYVPPTTKPAPTTKPTTSPTTAPTEGEAAPGAKPTVPKETTPEETKPESTEPKQETITWVCPVGSYKLTSPFGMRLHPIYGDMRMHNGIDMQCPAGTPIYATRSGQVSIATWSDTAGNYVQINHGDGYRSVYMHMTHYIVYVGQFVAAGQVIGYVGNTGVSEVDHLHFGVSFDGNYINPYPLIA